MKRIERVNECCRGCCMLRSQFNFIEIFTAENQTGVERISTWKKERGVI
jgi:hypothetical protein